MLKFSELQNLSGADLLAKIEPVSAKLVPELVSKGILNANGVTKLVTDDMFSTELEYTVDGNKLFANVDGNISQDYVISVFENGFNVVNLESESCANIEIESQEGNVLNCDDCCFVPLCQVDMFDME